MSSEKKRTREIPSENPDPTICSFYLDHKSRFCKTERKLGSKFCATHSGTQESESGEKRVPCPINPNHSVYESRLEKHIKVCPDLRHITTDLPFYEEDIHANRGQPFVTAAPGPFPSDSFSLKDFPVEELEGLVKKVKESFKVGVEPELRNFTAELESSVSLSANDSQKHTPQHRALLRCIDYVLEQWGVGGEKDVPQIDGFVELGAGKGGLSLALQDVLLRGESDDASFHFPKVVRKRPKLFVVDMGGFRRKADSRVNHSEIPMTRWRINLKDFSLTKALSRESDPTESLTTLTVLGKHLCGACTDFALSCCTEPSLLQTNPPHLCALVIATCCHHRCELKHLNAFGFSEAGCCLTLPGTDCIVSAREFAAITKMSSWAVSGRFVDDEKRTVGRYCKRILDLWRVLYLREKGFKARLLTYTTTNVTDENVCIVAWKE